MYPPDGRGAGGGGAGAPHRSLAVTARLLALSALLGWNAAPAAGQPRPAATKQMQVSSWIAGRELPATGASGVARTPDGYLWLGAGAGLVRFDGVRFLALDGRSIPSLGTPEPVGVEPLLVDRSGALWLARSDGALVRYRDGRFEVVGQPQDRLIGAGQMVEDGRGRLWIVAEGRLLAWREGAPMAPDLPDGTPVTGVSGIVADGGSGLWIGTETDGLWHVEGGGARREPRPQPTRDHDPLRPLLLDRAGRLWVGGGGLHVLVDGAWSRVELDTGVLVAAAAAAPDGSIWLASAGAGVLRWQDGALERLTTDDGLVYAAPAGMLADAEGDVWLASEAGLDRVRRTPFATLGRDDGLPLDDPLHVVGDEAGTVWVMDRTGRIYHLDGGPVRSERGPIRARSRASPDELFLAPAAGGGVWTYRSRDHRIFRVRDRGTRAVAASPDLAWTGTLEGAVGADGTLWLGARGGGFGRVRSFAYEAIALPGLGAAPPVASLAVDGRGRIWAAAYGTPRLFELEGDSVTGVFGEESGVVAPLLHLTPESGDTLWATTGSGELVRIAGGHAVPIVEPALRRALALASVTLVADGTHLWIGTAGGIGRLPLAALHAAADGTGPAPAPRWFGPSDGLPSARTTRYEGPTGFRAGDGRVWFATPSGLAVVDPTVLPVNRVPPTPRVDAVRVAGRGGTVKNGEEVAPNPERIEVSFTAGSLRTPDRVTVEYRLDGADADWLPAQGTRSASYAQLRPGSYLFRVRARNEDGVSSVADAGLAFRVLPAWYQHGWFLPLTLLAVAAAGAATVAARGRVQSLARTRRMAERYEAALSERTRMAQELHDTLLQGFVGVTLHLQALERQMRLSPDEVVEAMGRILAMADEALREGRRTVWDMRAPELEHHDLPRALEAAARRGVDGLPTSVSYVVRGPPRRLAPAIESTVLRVGREAITNALRHGRAGEISLVLSFGAEEVTLEVRDDGVGFDPARIRATETSGHWGLVGMRERARRVGGDLVVLSRPGGGTTVELSMPTDGATLH